MHLLILGWSSIVRRRVLPAARSCTRILRISVASRTRAAGEMPPGVTWHQDYEEALSSSGADLVYVSGVNAVHGTWVTRALERGAHVIVDKPAFLDVASAEAAVALARRVGKGLGEATVFAFHPQMSALRSLLAPGDLASTRVTACLSIPPLPREDFRYRRDCGGGSLYDLGPYVAATNRLVFGAAPATVECAVLSVAGTPAVDTSFSVLLTHREGGALTGHCGFVTAYQNRLSVLSRSLAIDVERIFSTPPDLACTLRVREQDRDRSVPVPAADAFAQFLDAFCDAVHDLDFTAFESALLEDARLVARLRQAAGQSQG